MIFTLPISPLQKLASPLSDSKMVSMWIKRDDLLHPVIQGSKARKITAILPTVQAQFPGGILTFGGAFSNHLHAVAAAGHTFGIPTYGIIRGSYADLGNPTLRACLDYGMQLNLWPKSTYDALQKNENNTSLREQYPHTYLLPEGGNTAAAVLACQQIGHEIYEQLPEFAWESPVFFCVPAGTGCTAAGMMSGFFAKPPTTLVFPVTAQGVDENSIRALLPAHAQPNFRLVRDYIGGGFARLDAPILDFIRSFKQAEGILLDPIYTGKMMLGVYDLLQKGMFPEYSTVVVLHTGGLQGWDGFNARYDLRIAR